MFTQLRRLCLVGLAVLLTTVSVQAQVERGSRCQKLDTEFGLLYGRWRWLDADTVMFGVWDGFPDDLLTKPSYAWYQYHPTTGVLEKLNDNPYNQLNIASSKLSQLKNVQAGLKGLYENVNVSPKQNVIIYPRQDGNTLDTWLIDPHINIETALGIGGGYVDVIWRDDEKQLLLTGLDNASNVLAPIQLVTLGGSKVSVQQLDKIKSLADILPASKAFNVHGISPDGRYILITPETTQYITWVLDLNQEKVNPLKFLLTGLTKVVWTSPSTFIAITFLGAIRYDILTGKQEVLAQPSEIGQYEPNLPNDAFVVGGGSLSYDGRYLMAQGQQNAKQQIVVCKIY